MGNIVVRETGLLELAGKRYRCALGRGGLSTTKREGDGATPVGVWPLRRVLYRPDRIEPPETALDLAAIRIDDGWCDDPGHVDYNSAVTLPHEASCERLWRTDSLYDIIVVLGHNDDPVVAGAGSAIFLHVARDDYGPTEGCVALSEADLREVLAAADTTTALEVHMD